MKEKMILTTALIMTILGLSFLLIFSDKFQLETITSLHTIEVEETVKIQGKVERLSQQDKALFITINGYRLEVLDIVAFNDKELPIKQGSYVEIIGEVEEYNGKKEVIASEIYVR